MQVCTYLQFVLGDGLMLRQLSPLRTQDQGVGSRLLAARGRPILVFVVRILPIPRAGKSLLHLGQLHFKELHAIFHSGGFAHCAQLRIDGVRRGCVREGRYWPGRGCVHDIQR